MLGSRFSLADQKMEELGKCWNAGANDHSGALDAEKR